jgi:hypothetical protein
MSFVLFLVCGVLVALLATAFYNHGSLVRQWTFVLEGHHEHTISTYQDKASGEWKAMSSAYRRAAIARASGSHEEAVRLLDVGLKLAERFAEDWISVLRMVGLLSRMADAVTPISPLPVWAFRLPALRGLALFNAMLHHVVVTTGERLRLRCYVLRGCWRVARGSVRKSTARIRNGQDAWRRLMMARDDIATSTEETIRSFHAVLLSLSARPSAAAEAAAERRG